MVFTFFSLLNDILAWEGANHERREMRNEDMNGRGADKWKAIKKREMNK